MNVMSDHISKIWYENDQLWLNNMNISETITNTIQV